MSQPMTIFGKNAIDKELDQLIKVDREALKVEIAEARAHGDLKENAEYHAAKEKQGHVEGRIGELQGKVAACVIVDPKSVTAKKIVFGATVSIFNDEKGESRTIQIVGEDEAKTDQDKISFSSPLGKALIGKEEGDEAIVKAPKGDVIYEIESFEYK